MKKRTIELIITVTGIIVEIISAITDTIKGGKNNDGSGSGKEK